ncbi:MAG: hypothetical protein HKN94_09920 [Acidimicrobiales bacterium]|nr:hypothetical protein [Acidimicrobiia bacterium]NNC80455.1 hypothetical protein [Acidimicrobiales bacterium]
MTDANQRSEALSAAAARRVELKSAVSELERAAAAPAASPGWSERLLGELDDLRTALEQHIEEVEAEEGLLAELARESPRLITRINKVQSEHPELLSQLDRTVQGVKTATDPDNARRAVLDILHAVARHRQAGSDLVYEGYSIDIGGG